MKKLLLIACIASASVFFSHDVLAQDNVRNRVGFFLGAAGGDIDQVGIGGVAEFKVAPKVTIDLDACTYTFIRNVLQNGTFKLHEQQVVLFTGQRDHENLRRKQYYK